MSRRQHLPGQRSVQHPLCLSGLTPSALSPILDVLTEQPLACQDACTEGARGGRTVGASGGH
jgi:hypothetical protein